MRWGRVVLRTIVVVVLLGLLGLGGAGWYVADRSLHADHSMPYGIRVIRLDTDRIELSDTSDSRAPGTYRLEWRSGAAQISAVLSRGAHAVVRQVDRLEGSAPVPGTRARLREPYVGDPERAFGLPYQDVAVPGPTGPLPAWVVPGQLPTWAILLHGYGGNREDLLYAVPALHSLGLTAMLVTYRNDLGAAHGSHGFTEFGQSEWHDVDAAVDYAQAHGATAVVLIGASMGGTVTCEYLRHGGRRALVRAAVLDAPGLDLRSDMHYGARPHGLHGPLNWAIIGAGQLVMRLRAGINFGDLDALAHARDFRVPMLVFHGDADDVVSVAHSRRLAEERPDLVTLVIVHGAGHVESWNVDRVRYETELASFLRRTALSALGGAGA